MSKDHGSKHHGNHQQYEHEQAKRRALHKDWRAWVVVLVMLGAMLGYVLTLNEAESPVKEPGPRGTNSAPGPMPAAP